MKRIPLPLIAAVIAGVALWLSRASFDVAGTTAAPVRVAMLPSLPELGGLFDAHVDRRGGHDVDASEPSNVLGTGNGSHCCRSSRSRCSSFPTCRGSPTGFRHSGCSPGRVESSSGLSSLVRCCGSFFLDLRRASAFDRQSSARSSGAVLFGVVSVALSAPFVLNVRAAPSHLRRPVPYRRDACRKRRCPQCRPVPLECCSIRNMASWRTRRCCCSDSLGWRGCFETRRVDGSGPRSAPPLSLSSCCPRPSIRGGAGR